MIAGGEFLFIYDLGAVAVMLLLSYLSRRLGEALKIPPYYRVLYLTAFAVFAASAIDTLFGRMALPAHYLMGLRCGGGVVALWVGLRYWRWLLAEPFKK